MSTSRFAMPVARPLALAALAAVLSWGMPMGAYAFTTSTGIGLGFEPNEPAALYDTPAYLEKTEITWGTPYANEFGAFLDSASPTRGEACAPTGQIQRSSYEFIGAVGRAYVPRTNFSGEFKVGFAGQDLLRNPNLRELPYLGMGAGLGYSIPVSAASVLKFGVDYRYFPNSAFESSVLQRHATDFGVSFAVSQ